MKDKKEQKIKTVDIQINGKLRQSALSLLNTLLNEFSYINKNNTLYEIDKKIIIPFEKYMHDVHIHCKNRCQYIKLQKEILKDMVDLLYTQLIFYINRYEYETSVYQNIQIGNMCGITNDCLIFEFQQDTAELLKKYEGKPCEKDPIEK